MRFKNKIGVLGGSFDPAHVGHLAISKKALKEYKLKNPLKKKNNTSISERIHGCKKIIKLNNFIKIKFYEKIIRSNKTIDLINFLKRTTKAEIYFLMGADNLINFHKWYKWEAISKKCKIIVFDRHGYKKKSLNSVSYKRLNGKSLKFIEFNKVNISSSQLRKI